MHPGDMIGGGVDDGRCRHGVYLDVSCEACEPNSADKVHAALVRAQSVLAVIINAGLTFDGGVGGKFLAEIRGAEIQAREALGSQSDRGADGG